MYINNKYNEERYNRKKRFSHLLLTFQQIKSHPFLLVMFVPVVVITIVIWFKMDFFLSLIEPQNIILPIYKITVKALGVIIPIVLAWAVIDIIGSLTARKDEKSILMAFDKKELRNGSPVVVCKRKDIKNDTIRRVWYSPIPLDIWVERQKRIEHQMNETILKELDYDTRSKGSRIVMISTKGMKQVKKEKPFLDHQLEKDLEKF